MKPDAASRFPIPRDPGHPVEGDDRRAVSSSGAGENQQNAPVRDLVVPADRLPIDPSGVARLAHSEPVRWGREIRAAIDEARSLIAVRARWAPLDTAGLAGLFAGGTPVEEIAARGECWAFAATIGPHLESRVADQLAQGRYLEGLLLDAAGSVSVEAACDRVQHQCAGEGPSARFSPGYCLWSLENQKPLLALLRPAEMGVELLASMIMRPLKSVSGIIVKAERPEDLVVPPEECAPCEAVGCPRRDGDAGGPGSGP